MGGGAGPHVSASSVTGDIPLIGICLLSWSLPGGWGWMYWSHFFCFKNKGLHLLLCFSPNSSRASKRRPVKIPTWLTDACLSDWWCAPSAWSLTLTHILMKLYFTIFFNSLPVLLVIYFACTILFVCSWLHLWIKSHLSVNGLCALPTKWSNKSLYCQEGFQ